MRKQADIFIFNNERDTFSNPTLIAFISRLLKHNFRVILIGPKQIFLAHQNNPDVINIEFDVNFLIPRRPLKFIKWKIQRIKLISTLKKFNPKAIFGINPAGFVFAEAINKIFKTKLGYFSFEILFIDEINNKYGARLKKSETSALNNLGMLIIQDEIRFDKFKSNSKSKMSYKTFYIPVSPDIDHLSNGQNKSIKKYPSEVSIIYSGSISRFMGIDKLLEAFENNWDNNYRLFIHSRVNLGSDNEFRLRIEKLIQRGKPISLSFEPIHDYGDYCRFLEKFDIGLAFYEPDPELGSYFGQNIKYIGLASGKFSTYMMLGIPAITSYSESFKLLNHKYKFGVVLDNYSELKSGIRNIVENIDDIKLNCKKLYFNELEPSKKIECLIDEIMV